jgi:CRISPR system Cascade subunit CasA
MTYSFNLIDQPWIPCIKSGGEPDELSLRALLADAQNIRAIAGETPLVTAAIMPVVLALLHRVFGPKDSEEWETLWSQGAFPMAPLDTYFETWYDRFDLFHPGKPFFQASDDRVQPKSIIHLIHSIGNTATLFTHENEQNRRQLSVAEAARHLITAQQFRTAGLSGLDEKFTDSQFTRGVLFWAYGETVFESLLLNLMPYPGSLVPMRHTTEDQPVWEQDMPFQPREYPNGYLDYLTWPSNRITLIPEEHGADVFVSEITIAPGLHLAADIQSPQKRYVRKQNKDGTISWSFLYFSSDKALWRDYHNLFLLDAEDVKPPSVIDWLAQLARYDVLDNEKTLKLHATGMLADQAKPIFYRHEHMPLPTEILRNSYDTRLIAQAIEHAETVAQLLRTALDFLANHILMRGGEQKPDPADRKGLLQQWDLLSLYWSRLEPLFWEFITLLENDQEQANTVWQEALIETARGALDEAERMTGTSACALRGQVEAQRYLRSSLKKLFK